MLLINPSKQLENRAIEVFNNGESQLCKIKCRIFSEDNAEISVSPLSISTFNVLQAFEVDYADKIGVTLDVSVEEALLLLTNYQNLRITFTFNHVTQNNYIIIDSIPPEIKKYQVIIRNPMDILKAISKVETTTSKENNSSTKTHQPDDIRSRRFNLQVDLLAEDLYLMRERPFNSLLTNVKMIDIIHYIANVLDTKQIKMLKHPDNERVYKSIPIPPMQTLGTIFDQLQDTYGCYQKGLEFYYVDKVLYVYPGYETDPESEKVLHLYRLPKNNFGGCKSYHSIDYEGNIHVVLIDDVVLMNLTEEGVENLGNYQIARRSDAGIDVDVKMNGKEAELRKTNLISSAATNEKTATSGKVSAKYISTTNNAFMMSSEMSSYMCKLITTQWRMAWPWLLTPGMKIIYHYEEMGGLKTTTGILSGVEYSLERLTGLIGTAYSYAWVALIMGRLSPNEQDEEKISKDMLNTLNRNYV